MKVFSVIGLILAAIFGGDVVLGKKITTESLARNNGYDFEDHTVQTEDGYLLGLHRMSNPSSVDKKKVALLLHGLQSSSSDFLILGPGKALGFILADDGWDVWIGNCRGNTYSRRHITLDPSVPGAFWDYSFHEIGTKDLPAIIDCIRKETGQDEMRFFGHGLGAVSFFVMSSLNETYQQYIKSAHLMTPLVYIAQLSSAHLEDAYKLMALANPLPSFEGRIEFKVNETSTKKAGAGLCNSEPRELCSNAFFLLVGYNNVTVDPEIITDVLATVPAGSSVKNFLHLFQIHDSKQFRQYDNGLVENMAKYNNTEPPLYPLGKVKVPIFLYYGKEDCVIHAKEMDRIAREVPNVKRVFAIERGTYESPLYGVGIKEDLYDVILDDVASIEESIARNNGYDFEDHTVQTEDGYLLGLHKIANSSLVDKKKVALLLHGLECSSSDFLVLGPGKALGFLLADDGWDVWIGNNRGNTYSRRHVTLNPNIPGPFWDYSFHEMGTKDLPAIIDYIRNKTGQDELRYFGHAQGVSSFLVMSSLNETYQQYIKSAHMMTPLAYVSHLDSAFLEAASKILALANPLPSLAGSIEFKLNGTSTRLLGDALCNDEPRKLCSNVLFLVVGFNNVTVDPKIINDVLATVPAGSSVKSFLHYFQLHASKKFQQYDYGSIGNLLKYKKTQPSAYPLHKVKVPLFLYYGKEDSLVHSKDIERIVREVPNVKRVLALERGTFESPLYAVGIKEELYDLILDDVASIE